MNTRAKGRRTENKAKKDLEDCGWNVTQVKGSSKWNKNVDFWGLFDLIAIRQGMVKFIQVKCNRKPNLKPFKEFWKKYCSYNGLEMSNQPAMNLSVEVWVHKDRKGWSKIDIFPIEEYYGLVKMED